MTDYDRIRETLSAHRWNAKEAPPPDAPGVYALFQTDQTMLNNFTVGELSVLYIGMTQSSLEVRSHFTHSNSGFSSPRRSLGALLRDELQLRGIPRSLGSSRTNTTNFRFPDEGEQKLTDWMKRNLTYAFCRVEKKDVREIEKRLISELKPPLNLSGWLNPQAARLRALRRICRDEARSKTKS
jgi:hypothetical protein